MEAVLWPGKFLLSFWGGVLVVVGIVYLGVHVVVMRYLQLPAGLLC